VGKRFLSQQGITVMTRIIVDTETASKPRQALQPVDLYYPPGRVLGTFFPMVDMSEQEPASPDLREELDRETKSTE
jgi:hypothetical protein